jgi:hypothetical protein
MPCPSHHTWLDHPDSIWWRAQVINFLIMPPTLSSLLGLSIVLITLFSSNLSLCFSLNVRDLLSHPYKTTGKIIVFYISIFTFLDNRQKDKRFWTEC